MWQTHKPHLWNGEMVSYCRKVLVKLNMAFLLHGYHIYPIIKNHELKYFIDRENVHHTWSEKSNWAKNIYNVTPNIHIYIHIYSQNTNLYILFFKWPEGFCIFMFSKLKNILCNQEKKKLLSINNLNISHKLTEYYHTYKNVRSGWSLVWYK